MLAFRTDMSIPEGVAKMRIEVLTNGVRKLANDYDLGPAPGGTPLPGTLALLPPSDPTLPVLVRVVARTAEGQAVVLREVTTTVPDDRLAMLPVSIQWLCRDSVVEDPTDPTNPKFSNAECPPDQTCIAGSCKPKQVDSARLPPYDPKQIFGGATGPGAKGQCFDTVACFAGGVVEVPDEACTLTAPPAEQEEKYNVALVLPQGDMSGICAGTSCLVPLERDDQDGWKLEGGRVKLPPGVCDKLGSGKIAAVATSTSCATRTASVPTCGPWSSVTSYTGTFDGGLELDAAVEADMDGGGEADVSQPGESLGLPCTDGTQCGGGQLTCLPVDSTALGGEGPPGGMCTVSCAGKPAGWCGSIEPGAICHKFAEGAEYCLKSCTPGTTGTGSGFDMNKCHGRPDMGCGVVNAEGGEVAVCLPVCSNDTSCGGVVHKRCDPKSGLCASSAPQATYGASCVVTGQPPDGGPFAEAGALDGGGDGGLPCAGVCTAVPDPVTPGNAGTFVCSSPCVVNPSASCGWNGSGVPQAACMKDFAPSATDLGELGTCVELCDCSEPCSNPDMICAPISDDSLVKQWGRPGYCAFKSAADGGVVSNLDCSNG